ncbi:hypothetical protein CPB85DRAFT_795555 [Mucidula mucida]|nr:hypothetical protein CPB85DRAFT_795555 [Mucidula mucida]
MFHPSIDEKADPRAAQIPARPGTPVPGDVSHRRYPREGSGNDRSVRSQNGRPRTPAPNRTGNFGTTCLPAGYPVKKLTPELAKTLKYMHHEKMVKAALERMPEEYRKAFMDLYSCQSAAECAGFSLPGKLNTNGFSIGSLVVDGKAVPSAVAGHEIFPAVWVTLSLLNHSCCQNVIGQWDTTSFSMQVRAARDIAPGEELTLRYNGSPLGSTAARHRELAHYKFQCTCPACQEPAKSDARRSRLSTTVRLRQSQETNSGSAQAC